MSKVNDLLNQHADKFSESIGVTPPRTHPQFHRETGAEKSLKNNDKYAGRTNNRATGMREMEIDRVAADPAQPRRTFDNAELKRLAGSIEKHGVMQPISVRWSEESSQWIIIDGERRFRASKMAGKPSIPCVFDETLSDETTIRIRQLVANCQREDLLPIEQARAFKTLMDLTGWNGQQLAAEINVSKATVSRSLAMLALPDDIQTKVDQGEIAASVAYELSHLPNERTQISLANQIVRDDLNRQEAINRARIAVAKEKASPQRRPTGARKLVNQFTTRHATISITHDNPDATPADLQKELLNVVKQLGKQMASARAVLKH